MRWINKECSGHFERCKCFTLKTIVWPLTSKQLEVVICFIIGENVCYRIYRPEHHHYHIICLSGENIIPIDFAPTQYKFDVYGYCSVCEPTPFNLRGVYLLKKINILLTDRVEMLILYLIVNITNK